MITKRIKPTDSILMFVDGTFIFCYELGKGIIKRNLDNLNLSDFSFENVLNTIEGLTKIELIEKGLDRIIFVDGLIFDSKVCTEKVKEELALLPLGTHSSVPDTLVANHKIKSRYFNVSSLSVETIKTILDNVNYISDNSVNVKENVSVGANISDNLILLAMSNYNYELQNYIDIFEFVNGVLKLKAPLDYETRLNYILQIKISDKLDSSKFWLDTIEVNIINVAELYGVNDVHTMHIPENSSVGTVIGNIGTLFTKDIGLNLTFTLNNFNDKFAVVGDQLVVNGTLDYESTTLYNLDFKIQNDDDVMQFWNMSVIVNIDNINDTLVLNVVREFNIIENSPYLTNIGKITSLFVGPSTTQYSLINYNDRFMIVDDNLVVNGLINYEDKNQYIITIRLTDQSIVGYIDMDVIINVLNVPDTVYNIIQNKLYSIVENLAVNTTIANLSTLYTLESGLNVNLSLLNYNTYFVLSGTYLNIKSSMDYETLPEKTMNLTIRITNSTNANIFRDMVVIVEVTNIPDTVVLNTTRTFSISETSPLNTTIGDLTTLFTKESGLLTSFSIIGTTPFKISGNLIQTNATLNATTNPLYNITVRITNTANTAMTWDMTLSITVFKPSVILGPTPTPFNTLWAYSSASIGQQYLIGKTFKQLASSNGSDFVALASDNKIYNAINGNLADGSQWKYIHYGVGAFNGIKTDGSLWLGFTTRVGTTTDWQTTSTHYSTHFAIKTDGSLWCNVWQGGSLVRVGVSNNWTQFCATHSGGVGIKSDGSIWGVSGDGLSEVKISTSYDWTYVSGSHAYYVAIKTDGTLWVNNAWYDSNSWTKINGVSNNNARIVYAGYYVTLIIKADGSLWYHNRGDNTNIYRIGTGTGYTQCTVSYDGNVGLVGKA